MSACNKKSYILKDLITDINSLCTIQLNNLLPHIKDGHYDGRSFYGELYTALALQIHDPIRNNSTLKSLLTWYDTSDKSCENFHWEFNNYALLKLTELDPSLSTFCHKPLHYKGTPCTNWSLLRMICRIKEKSVNHKENPVYLLRKMQLSNGLILDESHVSSFQYHCFMLALVYEFYKETDDAFYKEVFMKGVQFINNFTMSTGDTLTVGRGQEQLFGYGPLEYIYAAAYAITLEKKYLSCMLQVLEYIKNFLSTSGHLPLVLNKHETDSEMTLDIKDSRHLGWYSYNNYYDYLPFFTYYLLESRCVLEKLPNVRFDTLIQKSNYCDGSFAFFTNGPWEAIISCKKGASANALVFPFITYNGKELTSVCGGDDYMDVGYYQLNSIPMPSGEYLHKFLHLFDSVDYCKSYLRSIVRKNKLFSNVYLWKYGNHTVSLDSNNVIVLFSSCIDYQFERTILFEETSIVVHEKIMFLRNVTFSHFTIIKCVLPELHQVTNSLFESPLFTLHFTNGIPKISSEKYLTAKAETHEILEELHDFSPSKGESYEYEYIIKIKIS